MKLAEAIDRVLREQANNELIIETLWQMYAATVKVPSGGTQWVGTTHRDQQMDGRPAPWADNLWAGLAMLGAALAWGVVLALVGA